MWSNSELCRLRAVCRHMNEAVEVKLFSRITINISAGLATAAGQLEALASGSSRASDFAKTLYIRSLHPMPRLQIMPYELNNVDVDDPGDKETGVAMAQVKKNIGIAIRSLKDVMDVSLVFPLHLHSIHYLSCHSWNIEGSDEEWAICAVMESLSSLPSLTDFQLSCRHHLTFVLPLHLISGLRRITINGGRSAQTIAHSPELSILYVDSGMGDNDGEIPSLNDLLSYHGSERVLPLRHLFLQSWDPCLDNVPLSHFKLLRSFTLCTYRHHRQASDSGPLWKAFLTEGISLEKLSTDEVNSELMDFIASFSGLRHLTLSGLGLQSRKASDDVADMFFRHVLPVHRSTLRSLHLRAAYEGNWCFSEANAAAILDCRKLRDLSIALHWEYYDERNIQRSPVVGSFFHVTSAILITTQHLLLDHSAELLELCRLDIAVARSNAIRGDTSGNSSIIHAHCICRRIKDHMVAFTPVVRGIHIPEITVLGQIYTIVQNKEGEPCYRPRMY
jgi:hypothetical protein